MRKITAFAVAGAAFYVSVRPATAQYVTFQPPVIRDACYDPSLKPSDRRRSLILPYVNQAMERYANLARSGGTLDTLYSGKQNKRHWALDGAEVDLKRARDPWAAAAARFELIDLVLPNTEIS